MFSCEWLGATAPSPRKTLEHDEAEEELLAREVALDRERAGEERRGTVRWLRPDYQIPKLARKPGTHLAGIDGARGSIHARAAPHNVRIHDIRRRFASRALALGEGLPIIGRLLGHRRVETTARYAHIARHSVRESAERIAVSIAEDIL